MTLLNAKTVPPVFDISALWHSIAYSTKGWWRDRALRRSRREVTSNLLETVKDQNMHIKRFGQDAFHDTIDYASHCHCHIMSPYSQWLRSEDCYYTTCSANGASESYSDSGVPASFLTLPMFVDQLFHHTHILVGEVGRAVSLRQAHMPSERRSRIPNVKPVLALTRTEVSIK